VSFLGLVLLGLVWGESAAGSDLNLAQRQFRSGDYTRCLESVRQAVGDRKDREEWQLLLSRALLATGQYPEALTAITNALAQNRWSLRLFWQAREVLQSNGQTEAAQEMMGRLLRSFSARSEDFQDAPNLVVVGQAALVAGADPKRVLDTLFDTAKRADPKLREVYLASGTLALEKHDYALAARRFEEGLRQLPEDPDLHQGLAQAYAPGNPALMMASLEAALARNSNHVSSLLLLADHRVDAEDYAGAAELLDRVRTVNLWHPEAGAYRAVLALLQNRADEARAARQIALKFWPDNPRVDHLIGLKLSQHYRFAEGALHQRQALEFAPEYLPARSQLAQDLLRLGEETEGWRLASEVQKQDGYDTEAYNLVTLRETMGRFTTLTNADFLVRLSPHEAALYGPAVLDVLGRARSTLCAKYGIEVKRPTVVEVFPDSKDFAVRTFGMPGNPGYLGVCFGTVITANSPAAHPGHPANWQAMLWHEFGHVVTLQLTGNRMPRWLSEGISVYEERQAHSAWGQRMNPRHREMILGGDLTPVSRLSAAFLSPASDQHLQFAYYQSSLVVEFLVQRFGLEQLKAILRALGEGREINAAIEQHTAPLAEIERQFATFAREQAERFGPGLDWEKPGPGIGGLSDSPTARPRRLTERAPTTNAPPVRVWSGADEGAWEAWARNRPTNYWVMMRRAEEFEEADQWREAQGVLQQLVDLCPELAGSDSAYRRLASACRSLGDTNAERRVLDRFAEIDDAAPDAYQRLMELAAAAQDWPEVAQNARRYLAVDPLVALPYQFLAQAAEQTDDGPTVLFASRAMLRLDPPDPAQVHFRVAQRLHRVGDPEARRHVLQALEEAPRFQAALRLLMELQPGAPQAKAGGGETVPEVKR